jgi:hypothetical protein
MYCEKKRHSRSLLLIWNVFEDMYTQIREPCWGCVMPRAGNLVGDVVPRAGNLVGDVMPRVGNLVGDVSCLEQGTLLGLSHALSREPCWGCVMPRAGNLVGDVMPRVGNLVGDVSCLEQGTLWKTVPVFTDLPVW